MASSDLPITANLGTSKEAPDASGSRYRFRVDLEILGADTSDTAGSGVTIFDARSGERHVLTADEFRLCRAADGTHTLAAIRALFKTETGRDFPHGKLFAFFRRLRGMGLLEEASAEHEESAEGSGGRSANLPHSLEATSGTSTGDAPIADPAAISDDDATLNESAGSAAPFAGGKAANRGPHRGVRRQLRGLGLVGANADLEAGGSSPSRVPARQSDARAGEDDPQLGRDLKGMVPGVGAVRNFHSRLARPDAEAAGAEVREPVRLSFFNPNGSLGILATLTRPLKYLLLPFVLLVVGCVWLACDQRANVAQDISTFDASVVSVLILGLVIANFTSRLAQATLIRSFGGEVRKFGIAIRFAIPSFFVDLNSIGTLSRRGQLWALAMPLLWRLLLFCGGTLFWFLLREPAPALSHLALVVGQIGLLTFLLSAWPLLPWDGYHWVATYFAQPTLRMDAVRAVIGRFSDVVDSSKTRRERLAPAVLYLLAVAFFGATVALLVQAYFDVATTGQVGLLTAVLVAAACIALAAWAVTLWYYGRAGEIAALDLGVAQQLHTNRADETDVANDQTTSLATVGKVFWAVAAAVLLTVAFLPYRYHAAGTFEILPTQRTVVTVRTAGEIEQISVHEGDLVVANQVLAKLSTKDQQREVSFASSELQRAKAQLAQFGGDKKTSGGKDASSDLERSIADAIGDEPDSAAAKDDVTAANYTKTQAEKAARADVERLTRKLANARDQLADTTVRAPSAGRVMTPNVSLMTGTYLHRGAELLTLEDTHTLQAEISLPEADVGLVKIGNDVRLRPWANEDREIAGKVTSIAPAAQSKSYGTIVRVGASIPNPEDSLRPAMTGYAKIDGEDMRVWEAFLRRIIRIVRVEFWSWIP
jgi:multidrug efflux pump subunit AcrA (membrane-fusion protein)